MNFRENAVLIVLCTGAVGLLFGIPLSKWANDPMHWSCRRVLESPLHDGPEAASAIQSWLSDGRGSAYYAMMALCQTEPGVSIRQVAQDIKDREENPDLLVATPGSL